MEVCCLLPLLEATQAPIEEVSLHQAPQQKLCNPEGTETRQRPEVTGLNLTAWPDPAVGFFFYSNMLPTEYFTCKVTFRLQEAQSPGAEAPAFLPRVPLQTAWM